jgi:hypothetical protein
MGKKRFSPEQIITKLREAEVLLSQGKNIKDVCRDIGVIVQLKSVGDLRIETTSTFLARFSKK